MRIIFCGSGRFAIPSLGAISAGSHELIGVITQPPRPAGRGGRLRSTPVAELAQSEGLECIECPDINAADSVARIRSASPDVICVVDFGQLIRRQVRQCAELDAFNLHGSLLPELRGAAPVNWAIIRGYKRTGVTTFSLVDHMDAGPIYLQSETDIQPEETAEELRGRLAELGAGLVCRTIELLADGSAQPSPQDDSLATSAPRLSKSVGLIDWSADAVTIRNVIHGTWPWPGGQAVFHRKDGIEVQVVIARAEAEPGPPAERPGQVDNELMAGTGGGRLRVIRIKPAGKRLMDWRDFVNGYRVGEGDCFASQVG